MKNLMILVSLVFIVGCTPPEVKPDTGVWVLSFSPPYSWVMHNTETGVLKQGTVEGTREFVRRNQSMQEKAMRDNLKKKLY